MQRLVCSENTRYGATRQIQSKEKQDSARWAVAEHEGSNACTGKSTSWFRGRFAVGIRYKVHGEWRFFRWLCKEDKCMHKKANGVSDLEGDGERKEFCREDWLKRKANLETEGIDDEGSSLRNES